jgi:DNA polymerase
MKKTEMLSLLNEKVKACSKCGELAHYRNNTVFGEGDPDSKILFLGEAPGLDEDAEGRPFIGKAGQMLRKIIGEMGWNEQSVYIMNCLKCHPPHNRNPHITELKACDGFLRLQIKIIDPKWIICWGRFAAYWLLRMDSKMPISQFTMGSVRKQVFDYGSSKVLCTYHPSYIIRTGGDKGKAKEEVMDDLNWFVNHAKISQTPPATSL